MSYIYKGTPLVGAAAGEQDSNQDFCPSFLPPSCSQTRLFPSGLSVLVRGTPLLSLPPDCEASSRPLDVLTAILLCSQTSVKRPPCSALGWLAENPAKPYYSNILWRYTVNKTKSVNTCQEKSGKQTSKTVSNILGWGSYFPGHPQGWLLGTGSRWAEVLLAVSFMEL